MADKNAGWMDYVTNPKSYILRKYVFDLIKERYHKHDAIMERLGHHLVTESDIKQFGQLLVEVYEVAYLKAVEDHKEALAKVGFKATVRNPAGNQT